MAARSTPATAFMVAFALSACASTGATFRTLRRDDVRGRPLAWQVAMRNLVAELAAKR